MNLRALRLRLLPALEFIGLGGEIPEDAGLPVVQRTGRGKSAREYARWKARNQMARESRRRNRQ